MNLGQVASFVLGPVVTALLAGLGFWLREVRQRRNRELAYARALERAQKQAVFVDGWLRTHQQLATPEVHAAARRKALEDLQRAYAMVDRSMVAVQRDQEPLTIRKALNNLLLLERSRRAQNKGLLVLYYAVLALAILCLCGTGAFAGFAVSTPSSTSSNPSDPGVGFWGSLFVGLCCLAVAAPIAILPAWLLHRALTWEDEAVPYPPGAAYQPLPGLHPEPGPPHGGTAS